MGDFGNALYAYQSALSVIEQSPYQDQLYLAALYENLGISTRHRRRLEESLIYLEKALAIKSTTLGEKAPELGTTLINLGNAYIDLQDYQQAEKYYQSALAIAQQAYGKEHLSTLLPINNLGIFFFNQQKFESALYYFQLAYETAQQIYSANAPALAIYTKNISLTHSRLHAHQEALSMAEKGLSLLGEGGTEVEAPIIYLALLQVKAKSRFALANNEGTLLAAYRTFKKATDYLDATRLL
jgi:tetratricopeptide (TPR) repeat protein